MAAIRTCALVLVEHSFLFPSKHAHSVADPRSGIAFPLTFREHRMINVPTPVTSAVITGIFGLLIARVGVMRERVKRTALEGAVIASGINTTAEQSAFAYTIAQVESICAFNDDGSGTSSKSYRGIRSTQEVTNLLFEFAHHTLGAGGRLGEPVLLNVDAPLGASITDVLRNDGAVRSSVVAVGQYGPHSTPLSFTIRVPCSRCYCMTMEEAAAAYSESKWKAEYAATGSTAPTSSLQLEVRFPPSHREIKPQVVVFLRGRSEIVVPTETRRLASSLHFKDGVARLEIASPNPRLDYAISWMPPTAKDFARLSAAATE